MFKTDVGNVLAVLFGAELAGIEMVKFGMMQKLKNKLSDNKSKEWFFKYFAIFNYFIEI